MSYSVSNTASPPWIGMHIHIIKGEYKAYHGYVHHVNPSDSSISGLKIVVELSAHISNGTNSLVTVDYDDIREFDERGGIHVFLAVKWCEIHCYTKASETSDNGEGIAK
ncbi:hypothetical protein GG344DRAFT_70764 [Lentinula edodes]|nr:hypothetical protein GG344DRAFT_70764 [Lentinula edodes]